VSSGHVRTPPGHGVQRESTQEGKASDEKATSRGAIARGQGRAGLTARPSHGGVPLRSVARLISRALRREDGSRGRAAGQVDAPFDEIHPLARAAQPEAVSAVGRAASIVCHVAMGQSNLDLSERRCIASLLSGICQRVSREMLWTTRSSAAPEKGTYDNKPAR
jgi:hypothetical protein